MVDPCGEVWVIDLERAGRGDPMLDPGCLVGHARAAAVRIPTTAQATAAHADDVVAHYAAHAGEVHPGRLGTAIGLTMVELALQVRRHLEPGWPDLVCALLERARPTVRA